MHPPTNSLNSHFCIYNYMSFPIAVFPYTRGAWETEREKKILFSGVHRSRMRGSGIPQGYTFFIISASQACDHTSVMSQDILVMDRRSAVRAPYGTLALPCGRPPVCSPYGDSATEKKPPTGWKPNFCTVQPRAVFRTHELICQPCDSLATEEKTKLL